MLNPVRWFEIYVSDMKRAKTFYERVFGYTFTKMPTTLQTEMWGFPADPGGGGGGGCSGTLVKLEGMNPGGLSSIVYFASEDCMIEEKKVLESGGKIKLSKMSIGENGFVTLAIDTEGNTFGLHSMR